MRRFLAFIIVALSIIPSCKKDNESSICFTRTATQLKIKNNTNKELYITSFGQNILPLIDWAPICGNNNIKPNSSLNIELSLITGYSNNDKLVVYWWKCSNGNAKEINSVTLDNNQKECQQP